MKKITINSTILTILTMAIIAAGTSVFIKIGLQEVPVFGFTLIRFTLGAVILFPLLFRKLPAMDRNIIPAVLISSLSTANVILFVFGIRLTTAATAGVLYGAIPLITMTFATVLLHQKLEAKQIGGIILGFIGILVIILLPELTSEKNIIVGNVTGNILIILGVISFSLYTVLSKKLQKRYSPSQMSLFFIAVTLFAHIPLAVTELFRLPKWWQSISTISWVAIGYSAIIGTAIFYTLYQRIIQRATPTTASLNFYLQPIATFVWAAILLGEKLTLEFVVGSAFVFLGVWIATRDN